MLDPDIVDEDEELARLKFPSLHNSSKLPSLSVINEYLGKGVATGSIKPRNSAVKWAYATIGAAAAAVRKHSKPWYSSWESVFALSLVLNHLMDLSLSKCCFPIFHRWVTVVPGFCITPPVT
jgi:hypothetical protein